MKEHATVGRPVPGIPTGPVSDVVADSVRVVHDLRVPMRDGVELALDLIRPEVDAPCPVVLIRSPYDKTLVREAAEDFHHYLAERGYVVAVNDCRGRFNSDGRFFPYFHEADDGFDTIEWIAAQDWCDGNIGMLGGSYTAHTQWFAASRVPPSLKAIVPFASPPSCLWRNEPILGGALRIGVGEWMVTMGRRSWQATKILDIHDEQQDYFEAVPIAELPARAGVSSDWWEEMMDHPTYDEFWERGSYANYAQMTVPALNVTGWWDMNFPGAPLNFEAMRASAATPQARTGQRLVIGPWPHWGNRETELSGVDFGPTAVVDLDTYVVRFLDRWLKDLPNGIDDEPPVHVFVTGANQWWAEQAWPLTGTSYEPMYLHSGGAANGHAGDGALSWESPAEDEPPDAYDYDPLAAPRILWNLRDGPIDDREHTARDDVLCFTSAPLEKPLDLVGWVRCVLYASSSAVDTDWHVRLVDVHPDDSARFLCGGVIRARYRDSLSNPAPLTPGEPTEFTIELDAVGNRFLSGHRVRVEITSSWFTQFDRNLNSGAENPFRATESSVAHQRIYHQPGLASHLLLPVVVGR